MATTIYIAYADSKETAIASWFGGPQDELPGGAPANYGTTTTADPLWATFYDAQCAEVQAMIPPPNSD